jgi:hypothetical protein
MKLAMCCVAAVSLVACAAEVEPTGGGPTAGTRPDKIQFQPSPDDVPLPFNPVVSGLQQEPTPADNICEGCTVLSVKIDRGTWGIDEVRIASVGGSEVCRIYLDQNRVILDECGTTAP